MSKTIGYIPPAPQGKPAAPKAARKKADAEQEKAHD